MRDNDTVSVHFVNLVVHALRNQPQRRQRVLQEAGIDPAALDHAQARVPAAAFAALWLTQIDELQDEFFLLDRHGMPPGAFALICRALIQEPTLERALRQCLKHFALFLRDFRGELQVRGGRALLCVDSSTAREETRQYGEETFLLLMVSLLCWLGGRRITLDRTRFRHERAPQPDDSALWGFDLGFGATLSQVEFASHYLQLPVVQTLPTLKAFLRTAPQWLIIRFRNQRGLAAQVYRNLRGRDLEQWPTLIELAAELRMSPTTLRRRLEREGCAFQAIKDDVRRAVAQQLLRETTLSVGDVAERVGFQEPSAFHRAFRKWTGQSPGAFRRLSSESAVVSC